MVPLEALRGVRGGQGERRVGAAQLGQAGAGVGDRRRRGRRRARGARPSRSRRQRSRRRSRWAPGRGRRALGLRVVAPHPAGRRDHPRGDRERGRRRSRRRDEAVHARVLQRQRHPVRPERDPAGQAGGHRRQQLPPGSRQHGASVPSSRATPPAGAAAGSVPAGAGARISRPGRAGTRPDRLREPLLVVLDEPDRAREDRAPGSGSYARGPPAAGRAASAASPRTRRTSASRQP